MGCHIITVFLNPNSLDVSVEKPPESSKIPHFVATNQVALLLNPSKSSNARYRFVLNYSKYYCVQSRHGGGFWRIWDCPANNKNLYYMYTPVQILQSSSALYTNMCSAHHGPFTQGFATTSGSCANTCTTLVPCLSGFFIITSFNFVVHFSQYKQDETPREAHF